MNRKQKRADALKAADAIVTAAKAAGRTQLTAAERSDVQAKLDEVDRLDAEIAQEDKDAALMRALAGSPSEGEALSDYYADTADTVKELDRALATKSTLQVRLPRSAFKAPIFSPAESLTDFRGEPVEATPQMAAVSLRELFPIQQVEAPTVRVYSVGRVTGVDIVAEGEIKPELDSSYSHKDEALVKLAGRLKTSLEFDQDASFLRRAIMRQAQLDLVRRENNLVLEKMAATSGVLVKTGAKVDVLDLIADTIGEQIALNGFGPTFLLGSPTDLTAMAKLKASGSGEYLVNPFGSQGGSPFGLQTLPVPGYTPGTLWVGHGAAGRFYEHTSGVMVRVGTSGDDFDRNITTTVIEERVLPTIEQPALLTKITLT